MPRLTREREQAHTGVGVYVCTCQPHACASLRVYVSVCRLEELWRVGFMSQQVTDDQINRSRVSAFSWICRTDLDPAQVPHSAAFTAILLSAYPPWPPLKRFPQ